jgi:hypothetical protein
VLHAAPAARGQRARLAGLVHSFSRSSLLDEGRQP